MVLILLFGCGSSEFVPWSVEYKREKFDKCYTPANDPSAWLFCQCVIHYEEQAFNEEKMKLADEVYRIHGIRSEEDNSIIQYCLESK